MLNTKKLNGNSYNNEIAVIPENTSNFFPFVQIVENSSIIPDEKNKIVDKEVYNALINASKAKKIVKGINKSHKLLDNKIAFFSAKKDGTENMLRVKNSEKLYGIQMDKNLFSKQTEFSSEEDFIKSMR